MITSLLTEEEFAERKVLFEKYRSKLVPNRKSGAELLRYLKDNYELTEINDKNAFDTVYLSVTENAYLAERLTEGEKPVPMTFYLENSGVGARFYALENRDKDLWGDIDRIFVGIDLVTGYYTVEGSTMLWDELCAFRGIDEKDMENYIIVSDYILSLERFGKSL